MKRLGNGESNTELFCHRQVGTRVRPRPFKIAIVGLGTGALAGHLQPGDELTFYELDPEVTRIAKKHFHYLERSKGTIHPVVHGDARLNLTGIAEGSLDILLVDAFSSDAIPTHLLTREALELYRSKLKPDGIAVFHISNRYYDLRPVLKATAASLKPPMVGGYRTRLYDEDVRFPEDATTCYVLANDMAPLARFEDWSLGDAATAHLPRVSPWTDDYANILSALWAKLQQGR